MGHALDQLLGAGAATLCVFALKGFEEGSLLLEAEQGARGNASRAGYRGIHRRAWSGVKAAIAKLRKQASFAVQCVSSALTV